ncbi:carboxypeptidase M32 [Lignipirellula cremea]|uniref:Metal-dependent carboxypeptidase n=1 Tax=Lignipirellula cremea TaxID=2528010 RepID=A0A518DSF0_9BACT|nr:carboxypeptidase M32 [Lignipirellula cremea]QDU94754.1 Thermostable carboxypeptidase 1 [Lignipirellula cremea]
MPTPEQLLENVRRHAHEIDLLSTIGSTLEWDERTYLPKSGGEFRAEQITYLSGLTHQKRTAPQLGEWLGELAESPLAADLHSDPGTVIRMMQRDYEKQTRLPQSLVEELARAQVLGQQAWVESRKTNDFAAFVPFLTKNIDLRRQQAEAFGYEDHIYDALLDDYEPNERTANVARVLSALRAELAPLVAEIAASPQKPDAGLLTRLYPKAGQEAFALHAAKKVGFDFDRGRLDVTHHPFCTDLGPHDCRITTRYDERHFPGAFFGVLHEAGHGMYEQGLRAAWRGLPPGNFVSLGIHESQSRMWENFVGRSRAFWEHFYPVAQGMFLPTLADVSLEEFYFAVNDVRPSLIRVEADEATYNLHIIIRFELEQALLTGDLAPGDAAGAWREKYREYLGIEPPDDADGILQDVHWSAALIGYFPTYALGNLYAAQFYEQADADLGGLASQFAAGEFAPLLTWLNEKIHAPGQCYSASELVQNITGKPLSHEPLIRHLRNKLSPLYGL